jgi:enoyl-CoA hydratase/carnithine racemase
MPGPQPSTDHLQLTVDGAVARLELHRPDVLNALSVELLEELERVCEWLRGRDDVRVVVLAGQGRAFSAGADLASLARLTVTDGTARSAAAAGDRAASAIEALPQITVAQLHGRCVGGGVVLALACDLRVAATGTRFSIPEVDLGIPLAWGGIPRLLREVGPGLTRDLVLTCREFDAAEARAAGLVSRVVPDDQLDAEVTALAGALADKARLPVRATLDAVAAAVGQGSPAGWSDADSLLAAIADPESRAAGQRYLARVFGAADAASAGHDHADAASHDHVDAASDGHVDAASDGHGHAEGDAHDG